MVILGACVAITGALGLLDLLLIFGVIRRLRQQPQLSAGSGFGVPAVIGLSRGEPVAAFSARTLGGQMLSGAVGVRVAGFFSATCPACPEQVTPFTEYLASHHVPAQSGLSVVVTDDRPPGFVERLRAAGPVCVVGTDSEILTAFRVTGFPAFCLLDVDGAVVASTHDPARLPAPAIAA